MFALALFPILFGCLLVWKLGLYSFFLLGVPLASQRVGRDFPLRLKIVFLSTEVLSCLLVFSLPKRRQFRSLFDHRLLVDHFNNVLALVL